MNELSHIAIIMDGNGRWAIKRKKPRTYGHKIGLNNIKNIIQYCIKKKIKYLSLFVFSIDNWKRSKREISYLFSLLDSFLKKDVEYLQKNKIKVNIIGEKRKLKKSLIKNFKNIEKINITNSQINVSLFFNYSSKKEISNSIKFKKNKRITPEDISKNLYTNFMPDPDILIRTGGHCRISDFMLWQISYTEIFFIKKLWPDFTYKDLDLIIKKFYLIQRNYGAINE